MAPPRPCRVSGCPALVGPRVGYCARHADRAPKRLADLRRGSAAERGYGEGWRRVRGAYLKRHPLCEHCTAAGRVEPATEVDHIVALRDGGTHAWANLRPLCKPCHSRRTMTDQVNGQRRP
jgi:5-methylcytosine-specific restriction protein A